MWMVKEDLVRDGNPTGQLPGAGVPSGVNSGEETLLCLTGLV